MGVRWVLVGVGWVFQVYVSVNKSGGCVRRVC